MSRRGCLFVLLVVLASTPVTQATTEAQHAGGTGPVDPGAPQATATATVTPTPTPPIPTVEIPQSTPIAVPTVVIPRATATPTPRPTPKPHRKQRRHVHHKAPPAKQSWIWAFLTSYCPGSAGWMSSSGSPVFYGMLANDYYAFGTRVFLPVLGITGVVEDRLGSFGMWNHFDVWSPICYSTPTGWFRVAIES